MVSVIMYVLGIEIGGTKLQLGVGDGGGTGLRGFERVAAQAADGAEAIRKQIHRTIPALLERTGLAATQIAGVGVGFGGPVSADLATVVKAATVSKPEEIVPPASFASKEAYSAESSTALQRVKRQPKRPVMPSPSSTEKGAVRRGMFPPKSSRAPIC